MSFETRLAEYRQGLTGDFIPAEEANKFVRRVKAQHRDEYTEWLEAHAVQFCTAEFSQMLRGERRLAHTRASARSFAESAEAGTLDAFSVVYEVDKEHTRRSVADMTGADHRYVAEGYEHTGNRALLLAECHRVVARKVKLRRTADVLSEEQYTRLFNSILTASPQVAAAA